jgi:hypothetical protein
MPDYIDQWRYWAEQFGGDASGVDAGQVDAFLAQATGLVELPDVLRAYRNAKWSGADDAAATLKIAGASGDQIPPAVWNLVGMDLLQAAVDCFVAVRPGRNLARAVLDLVRPPALWAYCLSILRTSSEEQVRSDCADVMRSVAGRESLSDLAGLLSDESDNVQSWAAAMVFDMLWKRIWAWKDVRTVVGAMDRHQNDMVRRQAEAIRKSFGTDAV